MEIEIMPPSTARDWLKCGRVREIVIQNRESFSLNR